MEPLSTLVLVAAFLAPVPLTKRPDWNFAGTRFSDSSGDGVATTNDLVLAPTVITEDVVMPPSAGAVSDRRVYLLQKVREFQGFSDGWDGVGSVAPMTNSAEASIKFIYCLPGGIPLPKAMVAATGEVGFYWDLEGGYADISFEGNCSASFFSRDRRGAEYFVEGLTQDTFSRAWFFEVLGKLASPSKFAA